MINFGNPIASPLFIPDGTVNDGDKYHLLNLYFGIALNAPSAAVSIYFSVVSFIQEYGLGSSSVMTTAATSMSSSIDESEGLTSIIQSRGKGVTSSIDETGQSVSSTV